MYILKPIIHETIWGGRRLCDLIGPSDAKIGHLYLISGHENLANEIVSNNDEKKTLKELFDEKKHQWNMGDYDEFPLTVALVDASSDLSIQVHPNDEVACELENVRIGKLESWYFLNEPDDGWIYGGCECDSIDEVRQAIDKGYIDRVTSRYHVQKGECVTVEAGTLHSMTQGSLVYEVEYGSNFTYRFFDFNRVDDSGNTRELHIEKAFKAIDPEKKPISKLMRIGEWNSNEFYEILNLDLIGEYINSSDTIECVALLSGELKEDGEMIFPGTGVLVLPGESLRCAIPSKIIIARLVKRND